MTVLGAYIGGIHSMFSIWVFCLLQIIPFFLAFMVGDAFLAKSGESFGGKWKKYLLTGIITTFGFMLIFVPMGMPTTIVGKLVYNYRYLGNQFGGVLIGLVGLYFVGILTLKLDPASFKKGRLGFAFIFGMVLATAYKPCVTPTLTEIYNISRFAETSSYGGVLLVSYSVGVFTAINALALAIIWSLHKLSVVLRDMLPVKISGLVMLVFSFMIIGGYMTTYKSFLVGRFVSQVLEDGMNHGDHK